MFFAPQVVHPQNGAEQQTHLSALPRFLFIILERTSWNGNDSQKDYRPMQPVKKLDMAPFVLNGPPMLMYRLAAMISERNGPPENSYVTFINLDRHWTRFDNHGIHRVDRIEEMADVRTGDGRTYQASSIFLYVPCE
jgi:hypothetical protein